MRVYTLTLAEYKRELELCKTPEQLAALLTMAQVSDKQVKLIRSK